MKKIFFRTFALKQFFQMLYFRYDQSFEGLLTCIYDAFYRKTFPGKLVGQDEHLPLFTEMLDIYADHTKAERVLMGLKAIISDSAFNMIYTCFLSEQKGVDILLFRYICKTFEAKKSLELNFGDPDVLALSKIYKKVMREAERVRQFLRFQKTADGIFFACIEPASNVLPLSLDFFEDRFADQPWIIYDIKRDYGYYYDLNKTEEIHFENPVVDLVSGKLAPELMDEEELDFQLTWKEYLKSITIKERINLKLQRQNMPKRFWRLLTEKS